MDAIQPKHGFSSVIRLGDRPLSPWLRLAHRWSYSPGGGPAYTRTITDCMLMLQLDGASWIWWGPARGSVELPAGSVAFLPPGVEHALGPVGSHYAIHFDLLADPATEPMAMIRPGGVRVEARSLAGMPVSVLRRSDGDLTIPLVNRLAAPWPWIERYERLARMYRTRTHRSFAARCQAIEILGWALASLAQPAPPPAAADAAVAAVLDAISQLDEAGLARPVPLQRLARRAGMGRTAFWNAFVATTGLTPRAYVEARRIEQASLRLHESAAPVRAIASQLGFADPFHFSRVFRRVMGMSPRQWRQRSRLGPADA